MVDPGLLLDDPLLLKEVCWPDVTFYDKQVEMIYSTWENYETHVVAGNMLGKDFTAGYICLTYFIVHPEVRVITTSVKDDHLRVLWGEIMRFVQTSRIPLVKEGGNSGILHLNHRDIRKYKLAHNGSVTLDPISYLRGMVSEKGEGMAGHHAQYTLGVMDEASGIDNTVYTQMGTWAKRILAFGNPNDCQNFFREAVKGGDILADEAEVAV